MRTDIFIGIDMGSTGLKAVAFEGGSGATLASSGAALPYERLPGGGCELRGQAIDSALVGGTRRAAVQQLLVRVERVEACAVARAAEGAHVGDTPSELLRDAAHRLSLIHI